MGAGASPPTKLNQTPNADGPEPGSQNMWAKLCVREPAVRTCGLSCVFERETAQTAR